MPETHHSGSSGIAAIARMSDDAGVGRLAQGAQEELAETAVAAANDDHDDDGHGYCGDDGVDDEGHYS